MLYDRLKQIREAKRDQTASGAEGRSAGHDGVRKEADAAVGAQSVAATDLGSEWRAESEFLFVRDTFIENAVAEQLRRVYRNHEESRGMWLLRPELRSGFHPEQLVFFDLETTGLSGGAGNVAFLAGFGRLVPKGVQLHQAFLADYPGELEFLQHLRGLLGDRDVLVSYNGKSFDAQVLKTRFLMNGIDPLRNRHIDLLHPARRLWRRILPDCSLGTLERGVLDLRRELDIAGWEVPEAYFAYLTGAADGGLDPLQRMSAVLAHHEQDIVSLAVLMGRMEALAVEDDDTVRVDRYELGRLLTGGATPESLRDRGRAVLHELLRPNHPDALRASLYLGTLYRRNGDLGRAEEVWWFAYERLRSVEAAVALAKLYEHRRRDLQRAAEIVGSAVGWPHARPYLTSLRYRQERLERKISRTHGSDDVVREAVHGRYRGGQRRIESAFKI